MLSDGDYMKISQLFINTQTKVARLFPRQNLATAELLKHVDQHRQLFEWKKSPDYLYGDFCRDLEYLADITSPHTVDGVSGDWFLAFQYSHDGPGAMLTLVYLLERKGKPIQLPLTAATLDEIGCDDAELEVISTWLEMVR